MIAKFIDFIIVKRVPMLKHLNHDEGTLPPIIIFILFNTNRHKRKSFLSVPIDTRNEVERSELTDVDSSITNSILFFCQQLYFPVLANALKE